jgi:hypothetical protein
MFYVGVKYSIVWVLRFPPPIILLKVENQPFKQPKTIPLIGMGITRKETK